MTGRGCSRGPARHGLLASSTAPPRCVTGWVAEGGVQGERSEKPRGTEWWAMGPSRQVGQARSAGLMHGTVPRDRVAVAERVPQRRGCWTCPEAAITQTRRPRATAARYVRHHRPDWSGVPCPKPSCMRPRDRRRDARIADLRLARARHSRKASSQRFRRSRLHGRSPLGRNGCRMAPLRSGEMRAPATRAGGAPP